MAKIRGITIEIGGDASGLETALKEANKSLGDTRKSLKDIDKLLKLDPANVELLAQKESELGKAVGVTSGKLDALKKAAEEANNALANGQMSQSQYDALQREIIATENSLKSLKTQAQETNTALKSAQGINAGGLTGFANACNEINSVLAPIAGVADMVAAGIISLAVESGKAADDLMTLSQQTGMSAASLQAFQQASDSIDVNFETVVSAVTKMKRSISSSADAFKQIGVSVEQSNGQLKSTEQLFYECVTALGNIGNETQRDTAAMAIFGQKADQLAGLLDDGGQAFAELASHASDMGTIISDETLQNAAEFNNSLDTIKDSMKAAFQSAGANAAASLAPAMATLAGVAEQVASVIAKIPGPVMIAIVAFAGIISVAVSVVGALGNMARGIEAIIIVAPQLATAISATVIPAISQLMASLVAFASNPVVLTVLAIVAALALLGIAVYEVVTHWDELSASASAVANNVSEKFNGIKDAVATSMSNIKSSISTSWNQGVDATRSAINNLKNTMVNGVKSAVNGFTQTINSIPAKLKEGLSGLKDHLKNSIEKPFQELVDKAAKWGSDLMDLFAGGMNNGISKVQNAAEYTASQVEKTLGFSEPEQGPLSNFHTFAPDMIDLWVKGVKDNMYKVQEVTNTLASTMVPNTTIAGSNSNASNNTTSSVDGLSAILLNQLGSMNTNVNVVLEGDARGVFKLVRQENSRMIQATGYHALA